MNIVTFEGLTLGDCARKCDEMEACMSFEFGVDYGNTHWSPGNCQLQKTGKSDKIITGCLPYSYNVDLYIKEKPAPGYVLHRETCISGKNIEDGTKWPNYTVKQCAELCNTMDECKSFEFATDYGGAYTGEGNRPGDCRPQS